jgi:Glycosyl transferases group 1
MSTCAGAQSYAECRTWEMCRPPTTGSPGLRRPNPVSHACTPWRWAGWERARAATALSEAMAYGLAPVTTAVGSIGEAVSHRVTGIVVRPGSPDQITDALTALVTDEGLRARPGDAARRRAGDFGLRRWHESPARPWTELATSDGSLAVR